MADLQKQFVEFHKNIRLGTYEENPTLADKRDLILKDLQDGLEKQSREENLPVLTFESFDQGSYSMHTGIKPLHREDDYDIDVGLEFDLSSPELEVYKNNPVKLKARIRNALISGKRQPSIKKPCVRVQYIKNDENDYHVDLAVYRTDSSTYLLARGKEYSEIGNKYWDEQEPIELKNKINTRQCQGETRDQYRCIKLGKLLCV